MPACGIENGKAKPFKTRYDNEIIDSVDDVYDVDQDNEGDDEDDYSVKNDVGKRFKMVRICSERG